MYGDVEPGRHPGALTNMEKRQPKSWGGGFLDGKMVFIWILYGIFVDFIW